MRRSFWRHPFTTEDPLMSKWCNAELLQICSNEWKMHLYSALLCIVVHPKRFTIMVSPQPPPVCSIHLDDATAATGQRHQCVHHTPATGEEQRESTSQSSAWGLLGGHYWQGPVEGIWPGHRGYTPTLNEKCHGIFNDHRESWRNKLSYISDDLKRFSKFTFLG